MIQKPTILTIIITMAKFFNKPKSPTSVFVQSPCISDPEIALCSKWCNIFCIRRVYDMESQTPSFLEAPKSFHLCDINHFVFVFEVKFYVYVCFSFCFFLIVLYVCFLFLLLLERRSEGTLKQIRLKELQ